MDPRRAAHVLTRIGGLLELGGTDRFRARAYTGAADAVRGLSTDDITPLYRSGELASLSGVGPATLSVLRDLVETGESSMLERLQSEIPAGLLDIAAVPGLTPPKVALIHRELGVETLDELEAAARDGRLKTVRGFGGKTVERVLRGIAVVRGRAGRLPFRRAAIEAETSAATIGAHPDVVRVEAAGEIRRGTDIVHSVVVVAECRGDPARVQRDVSGASGVIDATDTRERATRLRFADDAIVDVVFTKRTGWTMAYWRATGSAAHVAAVERFAAERGVTLGDDGIVVEGRRKRIAREDALYGALGLQFIPVELREGLGEVEAAATNALPTLLTRDDIRGVLHCHSDFSDGSVSIAEMAAAAQERGWDYLGISDHSQAAFYAGGLKPDAIARQHDEIDDVNARMKGFRVLKGIECDILADGTLDYDDAIRDRFEYVIGSIHSRFSMDEATMTARILRAMDDPHLTILAHPTGRLILQREAYALDIDAVIDKAVETGVVIELNADPARLDLDWRTLYDAVGRGARVEIGPDAHSPRGLDHTWFGVSLARKAWCTPKTVLNAGSADEVLAYAASRRGRGTR